MAAFDAISSFSVSGRRPGEGMRNRKMFTVSSLKKIADGEGNIPSVINDTETAVWGQPLDGKLIFREVHGDIFEKGFHLFLFKIGGTL